MQKKKSVWDILPVILGVMLSVGTATLFSACGMKDDGTWMKCHAAQETVVGAGAVITVLFLAAALMKLHVMRALLYILGVAGCIVIFLIPGTFMPMCVLRTMRCYTVMQPYVRIMAVATAVISAVNVIREVKTHKGE